MSRKAKPQTAIPGYGCIFQRTYRTQSGEKRKTDVWYVEYKVHGEAKPQRKSTGHTEQSAAFAELARLHSAYQSGDMRGETTGSITFGKLFELMKQQYRDSRKKSLGIMSALVSKHLVPVFGSMKVTELRKRDIQSYVSRRLDAGHSPASINRTLSYMRRAMQIGADEDPPLVAHVPKWFTKLPEDNARTGVITSQQYWQLKTALPDHAALALCIGYHTGMRRGLILELLWEWVDMDSGVIRIPPKYNATKKQPRNVPIYADMVPMLEMARAVAQSPYVIEYRGSRVYSIKRAWLNAAAACGCPEVHFHDLRRTAATNALLAGNIGEIEIMEMCGWKSKDMLRRYAQGMEARAVATGKKMAEFLESQQFGAMPTERKM